MAKVLVIEDDPVARAIVVRTLEAQGHTTVCARDGKRGIASFHSEQPDLVITDIIMPEQEGIETIRMIRNARPDAKIIAMSGGGRVGNTEFLAIALLAGICDVIAKPFEPGDLADRVARCLGGR